jgi:integrase/recombinase XerD
VTPRPGSYQRPSTGSRRLSVVPTFYRTCVLDGILDHSPAEHVRRSHVPAESLTLGLSHLALVAMLGLLGLRLAEVAVVRLPRMHPHMLGHTFVISMLDAGVDLRDVQIEARHADPPTTPARMPR